MPNLVPGKRYIGKVKYTRWCSSKKTGTAWLYVDVAIPIRTEDGTEIEETVGGKVFITAKTTAPVPHKDGTPGRSRAERDLNALGYTGSMADIGEIGYSTSLEGNDVSVTVEEDDYYRDGRLSVKYFNPARQQMPQELVQNMLAGILGVEPKAADEGDDDVPSASPPPADDDAPVPFEPRGARRAESCANDDAGSAPHFHSQSVPAPPAVSAAELVELQKRADFQMTRIKTHLRVNHPTTHTRLLKGLMQDARVTDPIGACADAAALRDWIARVDAVVSGKATPVEAFDPADAQDDVAF